MMTQSGISIKELRAQFFTTGSGVLDHITQALNTAGEFGAAAHGLLGFGLLSSYGARLAGKAGHTFYRWWTRRGIRAFSEIEALSQDALLRRLPTYLGADLMDALDDDHSPPRIVILFDTYEALWRGHGLKDGPGSCVSTTGGASSCRTRALCCSSSPVATSCAGAKWTRIGPTSSSPICSEA
jgi:hypothetical protein